MSNRRHLPLAGPPLVQTGRPLSRRTVLQGLSAGGLAVLAGGALAGCGTDAAKQTASSCTSTDVSAEEKVVNFSNWQGYIDPINKPDSSLSTFEQQLGIDVSYNVDVNDNNDFYAKVRNQLGACEPTGRDIFVLTDWMAAKMIGLGWLQKFDHSQMPNVDANLLANLKSPQWDPNRDYSVPWQSGLTGIAYNADLTGEVRSMEELLTRSDLKGKITMLTEMRDTMLFMLLLVGADPGDFTEDEWGQAIDRLESVVASGQIRQFTGNDYRPALARGDIAACEAWSGDVIALQYSHPNIKFVAPEEGLALWSDNMLVPNKAEHKTNAEKLMNFYYDPMNAAKASAWINYICPVQGAQEAMEKVDKSLVDSPLIFPTEDFLKNAYGFMDLPEDKSVQYETEFARATEA